MVRQFIVKANQIAVLILGLLLISCQPKTPVWPTQDSAVEDAVQTQLASQPRPTLYPAMDQTLSSTESQLPTSTLVIINSTKNNAPVSASVLAGLIYDDGNLVQIGQDGSRQILYDRPVDILSTDGRYTLTSGNGDYWMYDLVVRKLVKLTDTPSRHECCASWWTGHTEKVLMLSNNANSTTGVGTQGFLSVIRMDGTGYLVLDPDHPSTGNPAVSPDGIWIAYGNGEKGWLFGGEQEPIPFDPADFGLDSLKGQQISHPAWSPDGTKIAWYWLSGLNVGLRSGVVVFDLVKKSYQLSPLVEPESENFPVQSPLWSPDGKWIAYYMQAKADLDSGAWVMRADAVENMGVHLAGQGFLPGAWNPEGKKLALYSVPEAGVEPGLWVTDTTSWALTRVEISPTLPGRIYIWK